MFNSILIKNSFLKDNIFIEFDKGLNILKGRNGIGKSCIIEYLNYSLFGSIALRGPIGTYPTDFEIETILTINNILYKIHRTVKNSSLYQYDNNSYQVIVTGITPVNNYIKQLLSYDYKIFSLTHYSKQHNLLKLTSSTPKELVELIEIISGLTDSYKLMFQLKDKLKEIKIEYKLLSNTNTDEDLIFNENEEIESLIKNHSELVTYFKDLCIEKFNDIKENEKLLNQYKNDYSVINDYLILLNENNNQQLYEDKELILAEYNQYQTIKLEYNNTLDLLKSYIKPVKEYDIEFLKHQEHLLEEQIKYKEYLKVLKQIEEHTIECPNCHHTFNDLNINLDNNYNTAPETPQLTSKQVKEGLVWIDNKDVYNSLEKKLEVSKLFLDNLSNIDYKNILEIINKLNIYKERYNNVINKYENLELLIKDLEDSINNKTIEYNQLIETRNNINLYIEQKKNYLEKLDLLNNLEIRLKDLENKEVLYSVLLGVLQETKKEIQTLSFPVLNSLASTLLSDITGGERNKIEITEDFTIKVDNLDIDLLEGSAQVIANISLRIALLNTFYKDNFSVLLMDEIDESLSEERFNFINKCFIQLVNKEYQLIIISHKEYTIGNIINLDLYNAKSIHV